MQACRGANAGLQAHGLLSGQLHAVYARLALSALCTLPTFVCSTAFCNPARLCTDAQMMLWRPATCTRCLHHCCIWCGICSSCSCVGSVGSSLARQCCLTPVHWPNLTCLALADGGLEEPLQRLGGPQHPQTCMMQCKVSRPRACIRSQPLSGHALRAQHQAVRSQYRVTKEEAAAAEADKSCQCMSVEGAHQQLTRSSAHAFGRCSGTSGRQPVMTLQITCNRISREKAVPVT